MPNVLPKRLPPFMRTAAFRRTCIALASLLLLYAVAGFFVLPAMIKSQVETQFPEKLHRRATLGKAEVNPFALTVTLRDFKLMEPQGDAVFAAFDTLSVNLSAESLWRLAPVVQQARLIGPQVRLVRQAAHRYNIDDLIALAASQPPSPQPARFSVNNVRIEAGRIDFHDLPERSTHSVTELFLGIPFVSSLPSQVNIFVEPLLQAQVDGSPLLLKGKARPFADPKEAVVELNVDGLDLTRFVDYLPFEPGVAVRGARLDTRLSVQFRQPKDAAPTVLLAGTASLKALQVAQRDGASLLKLPELAVELDHTDVLGGRIALKKVRVDGLDAQLARGGDGRLNVEHVFAASAPRAPAPSSKPAPLHVALDELEIRNGAVRFTDAQSPRALQAGLEKVGLKVRKLAVDTGRKTVDIGEIVSDEGAFFLRHGTPAAQGNAAAKDVAGPKPAAGASPRASYAVRIGRFRIDRWSARVEEQSPAGPLVTVAAPVSAAVDGFSTASAAPARVALKATVNKSGQLALDGNLGLAPFHTDLAVDANGVDILPLQPLIADRINLRVTRASLAAKGRLQLDTGEDGALRGGYKGDASLNNLATVDETNGNDFLRWKSLSAGGLDVRLAPFALMADQLALNDFFARVIIDPSGRINLQDIARGEAGERRSLTEAAPAARTTGAAQAATGRLPPISIRRLTFQGGRVRFSDNFIKPNYSASLTNLGGTVAGLSSDPSAVAGVDLRGEVNRAPLSIVGRIHPLRENLLLDIQANVRGMELADLSPYAGRYIGYGIEKGKLSFEVAYRVENRQLSASNRLILDQLTLSEESASSAATKLPVKLAIALLKDRDGVIDVNVPIEGSLDDPQFSVGGIVLKVIGNAIVKAVSQPFALLGSVFHAGGDAQLSHVNFEPGRAAIPPAAERTLDTLAKALANRPALQLEITGWADAQADYEGMKRAAVDRKVRAMKQKDLLARGQAAELGSVSVGADEYSALLARVYKEEKFDKPRNLIGLQKNLPVEDMERLIREHTAIDEGDLLALANRRAQAVKDWFIKFGKIPGDRLFILASKSRQREAKEEPLSKVEFSLR